MEIQRDLPAPSPTRFERVAAETMLTSVGLDDVVRRSGCQKVQIDAVVGNYQEVLPEYQVLHLLGGKTGALELVGAEYCASKTAKEMVPLDHNVGDVLKSAGHCLQSPLLDAAALGEQEVVDEGRPRGEHVVGEADKQATGVDQPAEDNQPFRRCAFGNRLVDGKDFVSG